MNRERFRLALALLCEVTERNRVALEALSSPARDAIYHDDGTATSDSVITGRHSARGRA